MTTKRRIASRWRPDQIDGFANKPDLPKADELAKDIGGAVAFLWFAEKDPETEDQPKGTQRESQNPSF